MPAGFAKSTQIGPGAMLRAPAPVEQPACRAPSAMPAMAWSRQRCHPGSSRTTTSATDSGADVRPDFDWNKPVVQMIGYRCQYQRAGRSGKGFAMQCMPVRPDAEARHCSIVSKEQSRAPWPRIQKARPRASAGSADSITKQPTNDKTKTIIRMGCPPLGCLFHHRAQQEGSKPRALP